MRLPGAGVCKSDCCATAQTVNRIRATGIILANSVIISPSLLYPACFYSSLKKVDCCSIMKLALAQDYLNHTRMAASMTALKLVSIFYGRCAVGSNGREQLN